MVSSGEILLIIFIIWLLFGSKNLPELARTLGKGVKKLKDAANDFKQEITKEEPEIVNDLKDIKKESDQIKKTVEKYKIFEKDSE
jgi:sec-independent protein translocase protein TatA